MKTPAKDITEIRKKIESGDATPEDIRIFIDHQVELETAKAVSESRQALLQSDMQAMHDEAQARLALAKVELQEQVYKAVKRFNDVEEESR